MVCCGIEPASVRTRSSLRVAPAAPILRPTRTARTFPASYGVPPLSDNLKTQDTFWSSQSLWPGVVPVGGATRLSTGRATLPIGTPLADVAAVLGEYTEPARRLANLATDLLGVQNRWNTWLQAAPKRATF